MAGELDAVRAELAEARRLLDARQPFHDASRSGDLVTRVISDVAKAGAAGVHDTLRLAASYRDVMMVGH